MFKTNTYTASTTAYTNAIATTDNNAPLNPSYLAYLDNLVSTSDVILLNADFAQKDAGFDAFIRSLIPILSKYNRKISCHQATLGELRFLTNSPDSTVAAKAEKALDGISVLARSGYLTYFGDPNVRITSDAAIVKFVFTNIWDKNILVLTQSKSIFDDCRLFGQIRSTRSNHTVTVKRIADYNGRIEDFSENRTYIPAVSTATPQKTEQRKTGTTDANTAEILKRFGL